MKQIHAEETIARDSIKRCLEKHRLRVNPFLSHTSWDSGFSLWVEVGIGNLLAVRSEWQSPGGPFLQRELKLQNVCEAKHVAGCWRCPAKLGASRPTGSKEGVPDHQNLISRCPRKLHVPRGMPFSAPRLCLFPIKHMENKKKQLDYCMDKILSR